MNQLENIYMPTLEQLKNYLYKLNYYYNWCNCDLIQSQQDIVYILGQKYQPSEDSIQSIKQANNQIQQVYQKIFWITYRYDFEPLLVEFYGKKYIQDTGWGCMVRVGQMMMAEVLKRFLFYDNWKQNNINEQNIDQILKYFIDQSQQKFSIQNISQISFQKYEINPGQWYNPCNIVNCLDLILLQESTLNNLKICCQRDNVIFFNEIFQKFQVNQCLCDITENSFLIIIQEEELCSSCQQCENSILLIILTRIGLDQCNQKYFQSLEKLLQIQYFSGLIGGTPRKAHYIIGKKNQQLIYQDPHYPQKFQNEKSYESYFNSQFRHYNISQLSPSMGITFYLRKPKDFFILKQEIREIQNIEGENFFLSLYDQNTYSDCKDINYEKLNEQVYII